MKVVHLARFKNCQTIAVLEALVCKARAGKLTGVAVCFRNEDGSEDAAITGSYARSLDVGAAAALRLSMRLARLGGGGSDG